MAITWSFAHITRRKVISFVDISIRGCELLHSRSPFPQRPFHRFSIVITHLILSWSVLLDITPSLVLEIIAVPQRKAKQRPKGAMGYGLTSGGSNTLRMMLLKIRNRHYFSFFALAGKAIDGQKSDIKRINIKLFPSSKRVT
ncbi:hypothetical protein LENED_012154 [Lentinula edodes]|uniref:Uncharacterized protein n=1 Tax=Lentinula edodes TaxID=5353 RepID=A0A1Q3ERU6_LENED|nr:hypothetical protein LENED_012154 [Lentinula edodes]